MMQLGQCGHCDYINESPTAICSKKTGFLSITKCPLMPTESPFTYPFSNGIRSAKENSISDARNTKKV